MYTVDELIKNLQEYRAGDMPILCDGFEIEGIQRLTNGNLELCTAVLTDEVDS